MIERFVFKLPIHGVTRFIKRTEAMALFEYEITSHPAEAFKDLVYFCSEDGRCNIEMVPAQQMMVLRSILNNKGRQGWELVQFAVGKDGILIFWKRMIKELIEEVV